jgi:hypothetical protein
MAPAPVPYINIPPVLKIILCRRENPIYLVKVEISYINGIQRHFIKRIVGNFA